jgi:hypothetical protein
MDEGKAKGARGAEIRGLRAKAHDEETPSSWLPEAFSLGRFGGASGREIPGLKPIFVGGTFSLD